MPWQMLAAGVALAAGTVVAASDEPPPSRVDVIAVASQPYQRMTVPVTIQGTGPYRFLIDTGAQATVLSRDLADKLKLSDRRSATLVGAASRREVQTAAIDGIELGRRNVNVPVAPLVEGQNIGGADGILGLDSLQGQRVLLDFRQKTMRVADARQLGGDSGYEIIVRARRRLGQLIITSARLDGVRVDVIVDTGAQGSTGNPALQDRLRRNHGLGEGTLFDVNGASMSGAVRVARELQIADAQVHNVAILFADSPTFHALGLTREPALILGMEQLRLFDRVAIDFQSQKVLFDVPQDSIMSDGLLRTHTTRF